MDNISISSLSAPTGMAVNSLLTCDIILRLLTTAESKHNHHHNRHIYTTHHALKYSTHSRTQQEVGGAGITVGGWVCVAQCLWVCPDCPSSPPPHPPKRPYTEQERMFGGLAAADLTQIGKLLSMLKNFPPKITDSFMLSHKVLNNPQGQCGWDIANLLFLVLLPGDFPSEAAASLSLSDHGCGAPLFWSLKGGWERKKVTGSTKIK